MDEKQTTKAGGGMCSGLASRNVQQTLILYYGFLVLGMTMTVCGPALPELEVLISRPTSEISWMFSGRAAGLLVGSLSNGALDGRVAPWTLLGMAQLGIAAMMAIIPSCRSLVAIIAANVVNGLCCGVIASGATMVILKIWSSRNGPWLQVLHCMFGVGAIICPFIVSPFLSIRKELETPLEDQLQSTVSPVFSNHTSPTGDYLMNTTTASVISGSVNATQTGMNSTNMEANGKVQNAGSKLIYGFLIFGILSAISGATFLGVRCTDYRKEWLTVREKLRSDNRKEEKLAQSAQLTDSNGDSTTKYKCLSYRTLLLVLVFFFYFAYFIAETNTASYLTTFVLRHARKGKVLALRMSSGYWLTFTAGRALGAVVIGKLAPRVLLGGDIILVLIFISPLMFHFASITWLLWLCIMGVGLSMATIYSTGITWLEHYIDISGALGAMFAVSGAAGEMVGSPLTGVLFGLIGGASYAYVMFGTTCVMLTFFIAMNLVARKMVHRDRQNSEAGDNEVELSNGATGCNEIRNGDPEEKTSFI